MVPARHHDRCHCRPGRRRLLPRAEIHQRVSARLPRGLSDSHSRWGGRPPRVHRFRASVGDSAGDDGRGGAVGIDRGQARPGGHRSRHRRSDRVGARRSARHPRSGGAGEDGGQRLDHRLGRFRRPRRPDRADLGRLLLTADPPAEPVQRRRPDRGSAGYRRRHRRHLRCATGRSGVGRLDPLPRRLRLPQPAAGFHRLGNRLRRARRLLGLRPAVRLHRRRVSLRKGVATTVVRGDRADRSRRRLLVCPSLSRVGGNYAPAARGPRCSNRRSADCWSGC